MKNNQKILLGIGVIILLGAAWAAYAFVLAPTKGPSTTPPTSQQPPANNQPTSTTSEPTPAQTETVTVTEGQTRYRIVSEDSHATFTLDEVLRGDPKTVVGTSTGYISGEMAVDRTRLASSTIGTISLNARTFVTDADQRNNAIRRLILKTENDANEFIVFRPTTISGTSTLTIMGDLTISGVTKPAAFTATTTFAADGTLTTHAMTIVKRADFNLVIPNIPFVANVEEEVELALHIVAKPVSE